MTKKAILLLMLLGVGFTLLAQENAHFSQAVFNQAYINPAAAGSDELFQATGVVRMEMAGFEGAPTTSVLNVNGPLDFMHGGVTLSIFNDQIGYYTMPGFNLGYAFRFPAWKGNFALGLSAGLINSNISSSSWKFPDGSGGSGDGTIPQQEEGVISPDFGMGAYYNDDNLFLGLSLMHLNSVKVTKTDKASSLPRTLFATAGYRYTLSNSSYEIRPSAVVSTDFALAQCTLNGHVFYRNTIWGGLSYRLNEAIVGMVGFELFGGVRVSYSYDFLTGYARKGSSGTHEILVNYSFSISTEKKKQQYRSVRYL